MPRPSTFSPTYVETLGSIGSLSPCSPPISPSPVRHYKVSISQHDYLRSLALDRGLYIQRKRRLSASGNLKAFIHMLASYINRFKYIEKDYDGWIPISSQFMKDRFSGWDAEELEAKGLIEVQWECRDGKSRRYRPRAEILAGLLAHSQDFGLEQKPEYLDFLSGEPWEKVQAKLEAKRQERLSAFPPLIGQAISCIRETRFNRPAVEKHLKQMEAGLKKSELKGADLESLEKALWNDRFCWDAILKLEPRKTEEPGIWIVSLVYTPQETGRIGEEGGLFQSCSREMKLAAFGGLPNVYNYDLSSSQVRTCLVEMEKRKVQCPWLLDYLNNPKRREEYIKRLGVSKKQWKEILSALLMAARLPESIDEPNGKSIIKVLKKASANEDETAEKLKELRTIVEPLTPALRSWHSRILWQARKAGYAVNALGIQRDYEALGSKKAEIAAHILQGAEACYIHTLTLLGDKHGFQVMSNQHDGLVTLGRIPPEAEHEAMASTGLNYFKLEEKRDFGVNE